MCGHRIASLSEGGKFMKPSTKDQAQGTLRELIGKTKETVGKVTNKPDLEQKGQAEKIGGKAQKKAGQVEKTLEHEYEKTLEHEKG
jgi:uncharacterized protein YjbJ (UPF0337 family)